MSKTTLDKLKELDIPEEYWDDFSKKIIDIVYEKFNKLGKVIKARHDGFMYLINRILEMMGVEQIDNINKFKVSRSDVLKLDGSKFIETYKSNIVEAGMNVHSDLYYFNRKHYKTYGFTVLKFLCKYYGYAVIPKMSHLVKDGTKIREKYYILEKMPDTD